MDHNPDFCDPKFGVRRKSAAESSSWRTISMSLRSMKLIEPVIPVRTTNPLEAGVHVWFARWMMLYLFRVYGLVVIAVSLPVLALYFVAALSWLVLTAIRLAIGRIRATMSLIHLVYTANWATVAKIENTRKVA